MQVRLKNRKEQIVNLGLELLQTRGFENFSYQDLARELGITKASIHHHFPKKADLGVALCEAIQDWHEHQFKKISALQGTVMEKLDVYVQGNLRFACGEKKICPLSSLQADIASLPDGMKKALKRLDEHELNYIADLLDHGREAGELTFEGDSFSQATLFVLAFKGAMQYSRVHGEKIFEATMAQMRLQLAG
ncbi:TetR/AcrR family transcriptional regulator [Maricurvus nonylphenolicus]|uniref:TetR/AcrR family transcriptional regulator n=1 Tax=Maricurvus nonylphenolicus TaxID=1008307 RepID=UPI0036F4269F